MTTCPKCGHTFQKRGELGAYTIDFERFWKEYDAATLCPSASKRDAFKAWTQIESERPETERLLSCLRAFKAHVQAKSGFMAHPATWLRQRRYEPWLERVQPATAIEGQTPDWGMRLLAEIGQGKFTSYFGDVVFESGPPPRLMFGSMFKRDWAEKHFRHELWRAFGEVELVMKVP